MPQSLLGCVLSRAHCQVETQIGFLANATATLAAEHVHDMLSSVRALASLAFSSQPAGSQPLSCSTCMYRAHRRARSCATSPEPAAQAASSATLLAIFLEHQRRQGVDVCSNLSRYDALLAGTLREIVAQTKGAGRAQVVRA